MGHDSNSSAPPKKSEDDTTKAQQGIVSSASKLLSSLTDNSTSSSSLSSSSSSAAFLKNTLSDILTSTDKTRGAGASSSSSSRQASTWAESGSSGSRHAARGPDISTFRSEGRTTTTAAGDESVEASFQSFKTSSFSELFSPQHPANKDASQQILPQLPSVDCQEAAMRDGEEVMRLLNDPGVELMSVEDVMTASSLLSNDDHADAAATSLIPRDTYAEEVAEDPVEWLGLTGPGGDYTEMVWGNKPAQRKVGDPDQEEEEDQTIEEPAPPPKEDLKGKGKAVERGKVYMKSRM